MSSSIQKPKETRSMDSSHVQAVELPNNSNRLPKESTPIGGSQTISGSRSGVLKPGTSSSKESYSGDIIPVQTDWGASHKNQTRRFKTKYSGLSRAQFYHLAKRKRVPLSEKDEVLQSTGIFLILIATITAFLPLFDLRLGGFETAGMLPAILSVSVVLIGILMTVIAQRNNPITAMGLGLGLLLMFIVAYIGVFDFFEVQNPFRSSDRNAIASGLDPDDADAIAVVVEPVEINQPEKEVDENRIPLTPNDIVVTKEDHMVDDRLGPPVAGQSRDEPKQPKREGTIKTKGRAMTKIAFHSRLRKLNSEVLRNGLPQSDEFESQYEILYAGDTSTIGAAYLVSEPAIGFDYLARGDRLMLEMIPFVGQPEFRASVYHPNGDKLRGLKCNFRQKQMVGVQPLYEVAGEINTLRSGDWIGRAPALGKEGTLLETAGRDVYGIAVFKNHDHMIGVGLIVKK